MRYIHLSSAPPLAKERKEISREKNNFFRTDAMKERGEGERAGKNWQIFEVHKSCRIKDLFPGTCTKYFTILPYAKLVCRGSSMNWSPITSISQRNPNQRSEPSAVRLFDSRCYWAPNRLTEWSVFGPEHLDPPAFQSHWSLPFLCALRTACWGLQSSSVPSVLRSVYAFRTRLMGAEANSDSTSVSLRHSSNHPDVRSLSFPSPVWRRWEGKEGNSTASYYQQEKRRNGWEYLSLGTQQYTLSPHSSSEKDAWTSSWRVLDFSPGLRAEMMLLEAIWLVSSHSWGGSSLYGGERLPAPKGASVQHFKCLAWNYNMLNWNTRKLRNTLYTHNILFPLFLTLSQCSFSDWIFDKYYIWRSVIFVEWVKYWLRSSHKGCFTGETVKDIFC